MKKIKHKYQVEYETSFGCFWDRKPAKYVNVLIEEIVWPIQDLRVLDLGAGEGKNSVFLANLGAFVTAIDISPIALSRFNLQPNFDKCSERIQRIEADIKNLSFNSNCFDIIIAYGVLHCFSSKQEIKVTIGNIKNWLKPEGFFVCATFTDKIAPPNFQSYLDYESFLPEGELQQMFSEWKILKSEDSIITESHQTSLIEHQHSIARLITQKP